MIDFYTAYTSEIDEVDDAVAEIFGQLDLGRLKKHTVGIISTYYDFIESGVVPAIVAKAPFDIVGATTMACAHTGGYAPYSLCLTVLSGDDVDFAAALSPRLTKENYAAAVGGCYRGALQKLGAEPALVISFIPYLSDISSADIFKSLNQAAGGPPIWGAVTIGNDMSYQYCRTMLNDESDARAMGLLLVSGAIQPEFIVTSIPERNIRENRAYITDSDGCLLRKINDMPALAYLESLGIMLRQADATTTPFMVYRQNEAEPVALGTFTINDDGSMICGGEMPMGAAVALGQIDREGIMETATASIEKIRKAFDSGRHAGMLLGPCVTRYVMMAPNQDDEIKLVQQTLKAPFMQFYAGGECCPLRDAGGKWVNHFHNYTFTACLL